MSTIEKLKEAKAEYLRLAKEAQEELAEKCKKKKKAMKTNEEKVNEDYTYQQPWNWEELEAKVRADLDEEQLAELDEYDDYDQKRIIFILHDERGDWDSAIESYEDTYFYEGDTPVDVVQEMNDQESFSQEFLLDHIDWEYVARDLEIGGEMTYTTIGGFQRY